MPENPLLPHRKLKELYLLMLRCRDLERKRRRSGAGTTAREALLAATTMQLLPGDLLCGETGDETTELLAPVGKTGKTPGTLRTSDTGRMMACAGAARGMTASASDGLVLAWTHAGAVEPGWPEAVAWAHRESLPLVLLCEDAADGGRPRSGRSSNLDVLSWKVLERLGRKLHLPVLAVDGEDAVAVYRVMQEAVIRARGGAGMAVIWAVMNPHMNKMSRSQQPVARMESYLKARKIAPPKRP